MVDGPRIIDMNLSSTVVHSGDTVVGHVHTSADVARVIASIEGFSQPMDKVGAGRFELTYHVPPLPFWIHGNYTIHVVASAPNGRSAQRAIIITLP
ncbi:MAG: hypothetical protein ACREM8_13730 [Vulcanimicrobiaceae bacterium]